MLAEEQSETSLKQFRETRLAADSAGLVTWFHTSVSTLGGT